MLEPYGDSGIICMPLTMEQTTKALITGIALMALAAPVLADDDNITASQRSSVLESISAVGCTEPSEIERDDGGYEVDNARCNDGKYDLKLSADFKIISRDKED